MWKIIDAGFISSIPDKDKCSGKNIIHMNLESLRYRDLTEYLAFYDYVSARIPAEGRTYLIFDELQAVEHWEKAIESFRLDFDVDIYITHTSHTENKHIISNHAYFWHLKTIFPVFRQFANKEAYQFFHLGL